MCEVVVGIDFGSSGTGYAFSYNNPEDIILGRFPDQGIDIKVPTEIILDKNFNVLAFGEKCNKYIMENQLIHDELYFKSIKMNLYSNKDEIRPENKPTKYPIVDVIGKVLEYIKKEALNSILANRPRIKEDQIKWVVTVPAIWDLSQKGIMIKASEKAKLFNNYTNKMNFFALEPEAASLYCSQDKAIDYIYLSPGKTYIICDLGGGTGDIVIHKRNDKGEIIEVYPPIGGNYGSDEIDKEIFNQVIYKLFGYKDYNSLKKKNETIGFPWKEDELYFGWIEFQSEFQKRKKITKESKDKSFFLNCQLFQDFVNNKKLNELVNKYNKECKKGWGMSIKNESRWLISFPNKIFYDLIKEHASKISNIIMEISEKVENIESIFFIGGYCSNEILIDYIKKDTREYIHLKPDHPEIAVVKGAVLFGINPKIINIRKAKFTIGFNSDDIWNEKRHGGIGEKYFDNIYNVYRCKNSFHSFIKIGDSISLNDTIEHSFVMFNPRVSNLKFYKTIKKNPILLTEDGVKLLGEDKLDLGKDYKVGEREFKIKMKIGGTYIVAECYHKLSGTIVPVNLYFN